MNCPNCGAPGDTGANYCVRCGNRLPPVCLHCRAVNPADSRFCHACGLPLSGGETAGYVSPARDVACPRCQAINGPGADYCYACGLPFDESGSRRPAPAIAGGIPAGFWIRLLAWFIDSILLLAAQLVLLFLLPGTSIEAYYTDNSLWSWYDSLWILWNAAYYTVSVSGFSTTPGKRALGLYVLRRDGSKCSPLRAFARYLAYIPSSLIFGAGYIMIGISRDKRGLHDHICDTVVVKR